MVFPGFSIKGTCPRKPHVLESPSVPGKPGHLVTLGLFSLPQKGRMNRIGNEESDCVQAIRFPCSWSCWAQAQGCRCAEMSVGCGLKRCMSQSDMVLSIFIALPSLSPHTELTFHIFEVSFSMLIFISDNESHSVVSDSFRPHGLYSPWNSPGKSPGVDSLSLLQGIFPTQELNRVSCIAGGFFTN